MANWTRLLEYQADRIEAVLRKHGAPGRVVGGRVTPWLIRFQVMPAMGARISRIKNLAEELAAALNAPTCRVARQGAAVMVEIPRDDPKPVRLLPLLRTVTDVPPVTAILGMDEEGVPLLIRLPSPDVAHVLVAGTTGSGKTALLRTMVVGLALRHPRPGQLVLFLVDPKGGRAFGCFEGLPHLVRPVVRSAERAVKTLEYLVWLMERRDQLGESRPPVVVFIDELADLMMVGGKEAERSLTRLVQRGREAGIHMVAATQKPTSAVVGSLVTANFPVRLVGKVATALDARVASGRSGTGAERLEGRGDFLCVVGGRMIRFKAAFISEAEIVEILAHITGPPCSPEILQGDAEMPGTEVGMLQPPDQIEQMVERLRNARWRADWSYRQACRALGEAEGGRRFALVKRAVDLLRATATATEDSLRSASSEKRLLGDGSGSTVAPPHPTAMGWGISDFAFG